MKVITKAIIIAALACLGTASCKKDNTLQYNNMTMGNVIDGSFISDQGNTFNVVEQTCLGKLDTMERAIVICDILNQTAGGRENDYDVRLNAMSEVLTKDILATGTELDEEESVQDPINIRNLWISGGYINMFVEFPCKSNSKVAHMLNLVQVESSEANKYTFRLHHNAYGETLNDNSEENSNWVYAGGYVSFPISTFIKEKEADIRIEWKWYITAGTGLTQITETKYLEGTYKKDGYEHVPSDLAERTKAALK